MWKNPNLVKVVAASVLLLNLVIVVHYFATSFHQQELHFCPDNHDNLNNSEKTPHELEFTDFQSLQGYKFRYSMIIPIPKEEEPQFTSCTVSKFDILQPNLCPNFTQEMITFNYQNLINLTKSHSVHGFAQIQIVGHTMQRSYLTCDHSFEPWELITKFQRESLFLNGSHCNYTNLPVTLTCSRPGTESLSQPSDNLEREFMQEMAVLGFEKIDGTVGLFMEPEQPNIVTISYEVATLKEGWTLVDLKHNLALYERQRVQM